MLMHLLSNILFYNEGLFLFLTLPLAELVNNDRAYIDLTCRYISFIIRPTQAYMAYNSGAQRRTKLTTRCRLYVVNKLIGTGCRVRNAYVHVFIRKPA